ncbi:MAG: protease complex subunit PrcB family protein [Lachnobacterium sp.]|nr:protease complex subunit PrcB family protein [Lachnobacterium sp.]MDD6631679.1 protease complex subunit PrcB family protein [Lachnobacterium sp.]
MKSVKIVCAVVIFLLTIQISGCEGNYKGSEKGLNLEYTVLGETKIPEEFLSQIEEKKAEKFELTYRDNEYLYIAKGFGEQKTSGSSISVTNLTCEDQTIYFESKLVIPQEKENLNSISSFPYIVIKTELIDFPVVFR